MRASGGTRSSQQRPMELGRWVVPNRVSCHIKRHTLKMSMENQEDEGGLHESELVEAHHKELKDLAPARSHN